MDTAICSISFRLHGNRSLKGKRTIAKSLIAKCQGRFNVSIAEVSHNDLWQRLTLGIACVSNDGNYAKEYISTVVDFINRTNFGVDILEYHIEVVTQHL